MAGCQCDLLVVVRKVNLFGKFGTVRMKFPITPFYVQCASCVKIVSRSTSLQKSPACKFGESLTAFCGRMTTSCWNDFTLANQLYLRLYV
jgi:hypothetical protein